MSSDGNLRGTRRTLDQCAAAASFAEGCFRATGWSLFDDSGSVVWDQAQTWVEARPDRTSSGLVFFRLRTRLQSAAGRLRPLWRRDSAGPALRARRHGGRASGRTAPTTEAVGRRFQAHEIPLDVLVVDMDWHTPVALDRLYLESRAVPRSRSLLSLGTRAGTLRHPQFASGAGRAKARGRLPAVRRHARRRPATQAQAFPFAAPTKPSWSTISSCCITRWKIRASISGGSTGSRATSTEIKDLDPLPWLNHLHFRDSARRGTRPMLYSRWGGLGNHRYPIGFSGDTYATWESLRFQAYFTPPPRMSLRLVESRHRRAFLRGRARTVRALGAVRRGQSRACACIRPKTRWRSAALGHFRRRFTRRRKRHFSSATNCCPTSTARRETLRSRACRCARRCTTTIPTARMLIWRATSISWATR